MFLISVIKLVDKPARELTIVLANAYLSKEAYLKAYFYFIAGNRPEEVVELLKDHIIS